MSPMHRDILRQLMPLELEGVAAADLALEGEQLDEAVARAEALLLEMFPDTTAELVSHWERLLAVTAGVDEPLQQRQARVVTLLRAVGSMTAAYYVDLAAALGYTVTIDEPFATEGPHVWRITVADQPLYEFYCGESCSGELLLDWPSATAMEGLFQDLKPAHSRLIIAYS